MDSDNSGDVSDGVRSHFIVTKEPQDSNSLVVQPILISSRPKAPAVPKLIPIQSLSSSGGPRPSFSSSKPGEGSSRLIDSIEIREIDEENEDDDEEMDYEEEESEEEGEQFYEFSKSDINWKSDSSSPLVSTSSHSLQTGVKLHIRRAPNILEKELTKQSESSTLPLPPPHPPKNQLKTLLSQIRNTNSLTIEPIKTISDLPSPSPLPKKYDMEVEIREIKVGGDEESSSIDVTSKSLTLSTPIEKCEIIESNLEESKKEELKIKATPGKRGRPKRSDMPPKKVVPPMPKNEGEADSTRRTPRDRKPTRMFMPDSPARRGRKKKVLAEEVEKTTTEEVKEEEGEVKAEKEEEGTEDESSLAIKEESEQDVGVGEEEESPSSSTNVSPSTKDKNESIVKRRRGGCSGRGRGRPRGSVSRTKMEREAASASLDHILDSVLLRVANEAQSEEEGGGGAEAESEVKEMSSPSPPLEVVVKRRRGAPPGPRGPRGSRGGSRGGGRKILKAKRLLKHKLLLQSRDNIQLFEEETRMSGVGGESGGKLIPPGTENEDGNASNSASASAKAKKEKKVDSEENRPVTAETLFEYKWPQDDGNAEYYFLQEQISEYLDIKSFKRKYPDLARRTVEMPERVFLRERKIVTETQCDLGLTALLSSDVFEIMYNDFRDKYESYKVACLLRREKEVSRVKASAPPVVRDKTAETRRRLLASISNWNARLNRERTETRACSFDLQTYTLNVQRATMRVLPPHATKMGYYPLAVLPGQYTDSYTKYSPVELKFLPLNSVTYGPLLDNDSLHSNSDESDTDSSESSSSDGSTSSSGSDNENESGRSIDEFSGQNGEKNLTSVITKSVASVSCKTCLGDVNSNKDGVFEVLIQCTKCSVANHPSCLELSLDMIPFIKKYNWQCTECKNCIQCNDPADEDKMLFCDLCDRGYHIYCVGLRKVPTGRWHCSVCSVCFSCGVKEASTDDRTAEWHHEFKKDEKGVKSFSHSICVLCFKLYKKGQFCPVCNKSHVKIDERVVECKSCQKHFHKDCVKKSTFGFVCDSCSIEFQSMPKIPSLMGHQIINGRVFKV